MTSTRQHKAPAVQTLAHVFAGAIILLKGFTASEHHVTVAVLLYVSGVIFILVALSHHRIPALTSGRAQRILFVLEAIVLLAVSYEMILEHKRYLQYAYGLAALVYFVLAGIFPRLQAHKTARA